MNIGVIGRSEFIYVVMQPLLDLGHKISFIVTSKAAPEYRISHEDFQEFATKNDIPYLYHPKVNAESIIELSKGGKTDICISVNYSGVIEQEVIELFPLGVLNAHGGDLPRYRGNACQAWAIINGEDRIGLCIHQMIGGELDSGPIIEREYFPLDINTRIQQVYEWIEGRIPDMMISAIKNLSKNSQYALEIQSKDPGHALRCYPRKPEDGKINWDQSSLEILRLISASSEPYFGAYCFLDDKICKIWRAELYYDSENYCAINGQVAKLNIDFSIIVISGQGKLLVKEIEYEGVRTNKPAEIVKSIRKRFK
jgi:UDP-4-amino-4-deoxy-L-arabinose formyltransferase/UDP-glucuronic acid dehydrogenase (UDP-4-keto-hexauronic acid decarboxylating)